MQIVNKTVYIPNIFVYSVDELRVPDLFCPMLSIERIVELKGVIKWHAVFCEADLNPNTMRSAIHNRRELRKSEATALLRVLRKYGVKLDGPVEPTLFSAPDTETIA